jgi:hypothetical protein
VTASDSPSASWLPVSVRTKKADLGSEPERAIRAFSSREVAHARPVTLIDKRSGNV